MHKGFIKEDPCRELGAVLGLLVQSLWSCRCLGGKALTPASEFTKAGQVLKPVLSFVLVIHKSQLEF